MLQQKYCTSFTTWGVPLQKSVKYNPPVCSSHTSLYGKQHEVWREGRTGTESYVLSLYLDIGSLAKDLAWEQWVLAGRVFCLGLLYTEPAYL